AGEKPKIILVTTAYHVFRSLLLARRQGIKCVGFGARTKWYFTLNALLREFIGYLHLTRKRHVIVVGVVTGFVVIANLL
ncbi:MAG: YdcF family protein, partial [Lachnospiraceae bacterium]|nr:YdcF family protein [Lachnospiraceae bacterium]